MTGQTAALGPCWSCGRLFLFDPDLVPSLVVESRRVPLCRACVDRANVARRRNGHPLIDVLAGAYPEEDDR